MVGGHQDSNLVLLLTHCITPVAALVFACSLTDALGRYTLRACLRKPAAS